MPFASDAWISHVRRERQKFGLLVILFHVLLWLFRYAVVMGGNVRSLGSLLYYSIFYSDYSAMLWWWSENRGSLCGLLIHTFINSVILITSVISHLHSMFALLCSQLETSLKRPHYSPLYCPVYIAMNFVVIKSIRWGLESPPPSDLHDMCTQGASGLI